jgi:hypothetical protein
MLAWEAGRHFPVFRMSHGDFPDFFDGMDRRGITLNTENYLPFYSVYALLAGSGLWEFVDGRPGPYPFWDRRRVR